MELDQGIIFLFFVVMILWTIRADFFLLIFVAAAYIYLLFIPINFEISIPPEAIAETVNSIITRIPVFIIIILPIILYNIYMKFKNKNNQNTK